jgi:hypothetical protein
MLITGASLNWSTRVSNTATEDFLPGAFSGAAFGDGLARDLSYNQPEARSRSAHCTWQVVFTSQFSLQCLFTRVIRKRQCYFQSGARTP